MTLSLNKSDLIGILSSALCLMHCIATPFLFAVQAHSIKCCEAKPLWWSSLDFVFLLISALAIYKSTTNVSKKWIATVLWVSWFLLVTILLNERVGWLNIPEAAIYVPSVSLMFFHWYGSIFCQCKDEKCCANT